MLQRWLALGVLAATALATPSRATSFGYSRLQDPVGKNYFTVSQFRSYTSWHSPKDLSGTPYIELLEPHVSPHSLFAWLPLEANVPELDEAELKTLRAFSSKPVLHLSKEEIAWRDAAIGAGKHKHWRRLMERLWVTRECYRLRKPDPRNDCLISRALFYETKRSGAEKLHAKYRQDLIAALQKRIAAEGKAGKPREERFLAEYLLGEMLRQDRRFDQARAIFKSVKSAAEASDKNTPQDETRGEALIDFIDGQDERCRTELSISAADALEGLRIAHTRSDMGRTVPRSVDKELQDILMSSRSPKTKISAIRKLSFSSDLPNALATLSWLKSETAAENWWIDRREQWSDEWMDGFGGAEIDPFPTEALDWLDSVDLSGGIVIQTPIPKEVDTQTAAAFVGLSKERLLELNPQLRSKKTVKAGSMIRALKLPIILRSKGSSLRELGVDPFADLDEEPPSETEPQAAENPFADLDSIGSVHPDSPADYIFSYNENGALTDIANLALEGNKIAERYVRAWFETAGTSAAPPVLESYFAQDWPVPLAKVLAASQRIEKPPKNEAQQFLIKCADYLRGDARARDELIAAFERMTITNESPGQAAMIFRVFQSNKDNALGGSLLKKLADKDCPLAWLELTHELGNLDLKRELPKLLAISKNINSRTPENRELDEFPDNRLAGYSTWIEWFIYDANFANKVKLEL